MRGEGRSFAVSPPAEAIGVRQWHLGVLPGALPKPLQGSARASAQATDNPSTRFPEQLFSIFSPAGEHSARLGLGGGTIAAGVLSAAKVVGIFNFSLPLFSTYQFRLETLQALISSNLSSDTVSATTRLRLVCSRCDNGCPFPILRFERNMNSPVVFVASTPEPKTSRRSPRSSSIAVLALIAGHRTCARTTRINIDGSRTMLDLAKIWSSGFRVAGPNLTGKLQA
jgi:hypothetical protein